MSMILDEVTCTPPSDSPVQTATIPIRYDPSCRLPVNVKCMRIEKFQGNNEYSSSIRLTPYEMVDTEMKEKSDSAPIIISLKDLPLLIETLKLFTIPLGLL